MMLHTKNQGSRPYGFKQEDFQCFSPKQAYLNNMNPRWGRFWPQWPNLNKLGRGPLGDATYQISRFYALWCQSRRFFHVSPYISLCKHVTLGLGHFWPLGHNLSPPQTLFVVGILFSCCPSVCPSVRASIRNVLFL